MAVWTHPSLIFGANVIGSMMLFANSAMPWINTFGEIKEGLKGQRERSVRGRG